MTRKPKKNRLALVFNANSCKIDDMCEYAVWRCESTNTFWAVCNSMSLHKTGIRTPPYRTMAAARRACEEHAAELRDVLNKIPERTGT